MALAETILETPRFPDDISFGSSGGPSYNTDVVTVISGAETRNINWLEARHTYNVAFGIRDQDYLTNLIEFFHAVKGKAYGFRFKDWSDYTSSGTTDITDTDQPIGVGDGITLEFQLSKEYTVGLLAAYRDINKPVDGTVILALVGVPISASDYSIDYTTGVVTFTTAPSGLITAGYEFDVPCRFDTDTISINLEMYQHGTTDVPIIELRM